MTTQLLTLNERDELKVYSLLTRPYFQFPSFYEPLSPLHNCLMSQMADYKAHLASMATQGVKLETDVLMLGQDPPLMHIITQALSSYL
jgi:hypothetical protein